MDAPLFEQQPRATVADGNYVGVVRTVKRDVITPKTGRNAGKDVDVVRWTWWLSEAGEDVESLTGIDPTSEKSNLFAHLVAVFGTDRSKWMALGERELVGRKALIQVVNDADGWPKVTNVTPLPASLRDAPAEAPAPVAAAPEPVPTVSPLRQDEAPQAEAAQPDQQGDLPF
jgi:hypothetical protein